MFPSASATPFEPSSSLNFAIYNDGVPTSVFYGCHPEHEVVQHIPDEAIDELFPPTAEEVRDMCVSILYCLDMISLPWCSLFACDMS